MEASGRVEAGDVRFAERSQPSTAVAKLGDLPALTGLRFFAAFFIFVGHATPMMLRLNPSPQPLINVTNCFLEVGMQLFFVLSGFVIHYNYADVGHLQSRNLARFYIARFARIYPLYVLFLILQLVVHSDLLAFLLYLGLTQSWVYIVIKGVPLIGRLGAAITWSISTEWFFYCLYPIIAWLFVMMRHRLAAALFLAALALLGLVLVVFVGSHGREVNAFAQAVWGKHGDFFFTWLLAFSPFGRLPPFLIGVATAHIFMTGHRRPVGEAERRLGTAFLTLALVCAVAMCGAQSVGAYISAIALFVYPLSIAVIMFCCARYRSMFSGMLSSALLIFCGDASYSIYLFHTLILDKIRVRDVLPWTWYDISYVGVRFAAAALITIVFSGIMYRVFEAPARAATRSLLGRCVDPAASPPAHWTPIILCVGIPVALTILGWFISLR